MEHLLSNPAFFFILLAETKHNPFPIFYTICYIYMGWSRSEVEFVVFIRFEFLLYLLR
jgi:hypothetical protein